MGNREAGSLPRVGRPKVLRQLLRDVPAVRAEFNESPLRTSAGKNRALPPSNVRDVVQAAPGSQSTQHWDSRPSVEKTFQDLPESCLSLRLPSTDQQYHRP